MKKIIFALVVLLFAGQATAQHRYQKMKKEPVAIGIRVGGNLANYQYNQDKYLNQMASDSLWHRVKPMVGVNVEIPFFDGNLLLTPEIAICSRGDARLYKSPTGKTDVRYKAKVYYLEAQVPVAYAIPVSRTIKPYVFAAPSFGLTLDTLGPLASTFEQSSFDKPQSYDRTIGVDSCNMSTYDYGLTLGAGLRFKFDFPTFSMLVKVEGGYHWGFRDTYSEYEHKDLKIEGKRLNRGIEAAISIAIPLEFREDMRRSTPPGLKNKKHHFFGF